MYKNNLLANSVRLALVSGAMATAFTAPAVFAAEEESADSVERIEVTGSRIKRSDLESASPVSVITAEDFKVQGIANVADALQNLTAQSGGLTAAVNNGGNGNSTVNLRGLGSARTLVLVNGRRMVSSGTGASSTVDLNTIPMAAVKRIEILKDGASAVYGSDAIAGVVNVIMRDDFEGFELDAQYGQTFESDGDESSVSATFGLANDKGNVVVNVGFYDRGEVRQADRAYSECPISEATDENGPYKFCAGSSFSLGMNAFLADDSRVQFEPGGNNSSTNDGYHPWINSGDNNDRYNYSALSYLFTPATRYNVSVLGNYELAEDLNFFAESYYTNRTSVQQMAPQPIYYAYGANGRNWTIAQDSDVYPYAGLYDFDMQGSGAIMYPLRRMQEVGPRIFEQEVNTIQITTGLNGVVFDDYSWEVFYTYGRNSAVDRSKNYINMENAIKSVNENCEGVSVTGSYDAYSVTGNDPAAPCINYFGLGSVSEADADYLRYTDQGTSGTEMKHFGANISGDLFELPAGAVGFALGYERREESAFNQPDAFSSSGIGSGNAVQPTSGKYKVQEAYFEAIVPVLADMPLVQSLDVELAARFFDYDTFGSDSTYKVGVSWRMIDQLMLRSVFSTAFRAPNVGELFGGQSDSYTNYNDPCNGVGGANGNAEFAAACQNDVNAGLIPGDGSWEQGNGQLRAVVGGNPDLGPETAETFTVGLVAEPLDGLSFTVDYYDIQLDNVISSLGVGTRLSNCYSAGGAGGVGGSDSFCTSVARNAVGDFDGISAFNENLSTWTVNGIDLNAEYSFDALGLDWSVDWEASYINEWSTVAFAGEDPIEAVGAASSGSGSIPEWKHNFGFQVGGDSWNVAYNLLYVDELITESVFYGNATIEDVADYKAEAFMNHNVSMSYIVNENIQFRAGIDNLLDEIPPYYSDYDDSNTDTTLYKYIGRNFFVGTTISF
jgi:iron complex outermembrane receptor protein